MDLFKAVLLGIVQGLTEFLPVSSSGHLVLVSTILNIKTETGIFFEVMLHAGTLVSIFFVFFKDICELFKEFILLLFDLIRRRRINLKNNPYRNMLVMMIAATIPTGLIGVVFGDVFEKAFSSVILVSLMLMVTGTLVFFANRYEGGKKQAQHIGVKDALFIGLFQGFAITPGISRSGSTIFAGLTRGFSRELATRFSFIMSIPAIAGASLLELKAYMGSSAQAEAPGIILIGILAAAISGTIAIKFLVSLLNKGKLYYFSYYCWAVGVIGLTASFLGR